MNPTDSLRCDDGERLDLKISGDGPPAVLLHGWTGSHRDWYPVMAGLERSHRVYRWDARGHGSRPLEAPTEPTVERLAADLEQVLLACELKDAVVVGHSMGALTLWQYLRDFGSDRLRAAVFIDQSPRLLTDADWSHGIYGDFDATRNQAFIAALEEDLAEAVLRLVSGGLNRRAADDYRRNAELFRAARERLSALDPKPLIECWKSISAADYRDVLGRITIPSLLVYGSESNFYTLQTARYVHRHIASSRLEIYEGLDHSPHLWKPARFTADLADFLASAYGDRSREPAW